jgi:AAA domain
MPGRRTQRIAAVPDLPEQDGSSIGIEPVSSTDWIRMMLYSYPGWGKTSLIAESAPPFKTLIIRSSMDLMPKRAMRTGAKQIVADTHEKMLEILGYCQHTPDPFPYDWVWWDCVSVAQDVLLDDVWAGTIAEKPGRAFIIGRDGRIERPNLSPASGLDRGEYGRNMERMEQWVRHMVGCRRFHFGMTAHPLEGQHPTNDEGGDLLRPYVRGKQMTEKFCGYCNIVAFLEVVEADADTFRRLHFAENSRFYAKDHFDAFLPDGYLDNPSIEKIVAAVRGEAPARQRSRRGAK